MWFSNSPSYTGLSSDDDEKPEKTDPRTQIPFKNFIFMCLSFAAGITCVLIAQTISNSSHTGNVFERKPRHPVHCIENRPDIDIEHPSGNNRTYVPLQQKLLLPAFEPHKPRLAGSFPCRRRVLRPPNHCSHEIDLLGFPSAALPGMSHPSPSPSGPELTIADQA